MSSQGAENSSEIEMFPAFFSLPCKEAFLGTSLSVQCQRWEVFQDYPIWGSCPGHMDGL